jgi:hypothetical protein
MSPGARVPRRQARATGDIDMVKRRTPGPAQRCLAGAMLLALSACAAHLTANVPLSPAEMTNLVPGRTLRVFSARAGTAAGSAWTCEASPTGCKIARVTRIYLAPGGGGWIDHQTQSGLPPRPGTMSMIVAWHQEYPSRICIVSAPLIGDMPSGAPLQHECLSIAKAQTSAALLTAQVSEGTDTWSGYVSVQPGNQFSPAVIEQYIEMVKALYGHQIPNWSAS